MTTPAEERRRRRWSSSSRPACGGCFHLSTPLPDRTHILIKTRRFVVVPCITFTRNLSARNTDRPPCDHCHLRRRVPRRQCFRRRHSCSMFILSTVSIFSCFDATSDRLCHEILSTRHNRRAGIEPTTFQTVADKDELGYRGRYRKQRFRFLETLQCSSRSFVVIR